MANEEVSSEDSEDNQPVLICPCGMQYAFEFKNQFFDKSFRCSKCNTAYTVRGSNRYVE